VLALVLSWLAVNVNCRRGFVDTALFGMVTLLKPVVPLSPVTVKDTVVDVADWFVAIVTLES
jgi:hypothetical protein